MMIVNEKYKFTIDKLVSIKEIINNIEENNYIDGYLGYEDDFYIDSILYYLKENERLKDKLKDIKIILNSNHDVEHIYCALSQYLNIFDYELDLEDYLKEN